MLSIASSCEGNSRATKSDLMGTRTGRSRKLAPTTKGDQNPRQLEQWQRDDARRLRGLWEARSSPKLSQAEFGAQFNIGSQGMVWQYLNGRRALNPKAAAGFAVGLKCQVSDFSPRLAREIGKMAEREKAGSLTNFTLIDRYRDAHHAAGPGDNIDDEGETDQIAFLDDWIRSKGWHSKSLRAAPARGRSMEPRIQDGDLLLIDTAAKDIQNGRAYAIRDSSGRRVKRLFLDVDGGLHIRSDNPAPEFAPEVVPAGKLEHVEIIGRVVWIGGSV